MNGDEGRALATEVTALRDELLGIANATHRGRPLFAGYGGRDAVAADGSYQGTSGADGVMTRRVGDDEVVRINVTADEAFGLDDDATNVFRMLDRPSTALTATDSAAVSAGLDELDAALSTIGQSQALVGVSANRVDSALRRSVDSLQVIRTQLSEVEDVDIAEAVMELQVQELAYQATLEALSRALPPSLVSFLR